MILCQNWKTQIHGYLWICWRLFIFKQRKFTYGLRFSVILGRVIDVGNGIAEFKFQSRPIAFTS